MSSTNPVRTQRKLVNLRILHYRYPLPKALETTMGTMSCRPALILRIEDEEGATGWGEIWCNFPPNGDLYRAQLSQALIPRLLADASGEGDVGFHSLHQRLHRLSLQAGEPGPVAQLCAGIDIAIHDLHARRIGSSIADILTVDTASEKSRSVRAYASGISPSDAEQQIDYMRSCGHQHFKMRIGFGAADSIPELQSVSSGMHDDETLMADANQAWSLPIAQQRVEQLEALNLGWLEEPLLADAPDHHWQILAESTSTPLAGGENLRSPAEFEQAIQLDALNVIQPDVCKWGGLSGCFEIARLAIKSGRRYCPHYLGGGVGLLASAQLLSATGHDGMLEIDSSDNPLQDCLAGGNRSLVNGRFQLADGPGLGVEPDIASARDYLVSDSSVDIA